MFFSWLCAFHSYLRLALCDYGDGRSRIADLGARHTPRLRRPRSGAKSALPAEIGAGDLSRDDRCPCVIHEARNLGSGQLLDPHVAPQHRPGAKRLEDLGTRFEEELLPLLWQFEDPALV